MSLLFDPEIAAYCRQHGNYLDFSHHTLGLVLPVYDADGLPRLGTPCGRRQFSDAWARAHQFLPDPSQAPKRP